MMKQQILEYLINIPKGKVSSYKIIADAFGIHPRFVAMTMKYNKFLDVYPCYKVIAHDGGVSGYAGGVEEKIRRLQDDGIEIVDGKIGKNFFWIGQKNK